MLILSRKQNERILFPNLGIAVEVMRIAGKAVRIGVDAPQGIKVLREEVAQRDGLADINEDVRRRRHDLHNRMHTTNLALHLLQKQLETGRVEDAESTLQRAFEELTALDRLVSAPAGSPKASGDEAVGKRRALLVEDNVNERELLAGYLRLSGYDVDIVEDGQAAMQFLEGNQRPDLVLLDMQMPRMDGSETISAIRSHPAFRDLKVFAVSGTDRRAADVENGELGIDRWFSKPVNPRELVGELNRELACTPAA